MKGVQCYELFGGIALKNHTFSFSHFHLQNMELKQKYIYSIPPLFAGVTFLRLPRIPKIRDDENDAVSKYLCMILCTLIYASKTQHKYNLTH